MNKRTYSLYLLLLFSFCFHREVLAQTNGFNYPVTPDTVSVDNHAVGSPAGNFSISPLGGAVYSVDIDVPPGFPGAIPHIGITYSSQTGNGIAGYGCNISGISVITRGIRDIWHDGAAGGVSYTASDAFFLDGQRLICLQESAGSDSAVYCLEADPYMRVVLHGLLGGGSSGLSFIATTKDGVRYEYGTSNNAVRTESSYGGLYADAWYLCKVVCPTGNYIQYNYVKNSLYVYLDNIQYGQNEQASNTLYNRIDFTYESRNDVSYFRVHGHSGSMAKRLKEITSKTGTSVFRKYTLAYDTSSDGSTTKFSRLTSITESNDDNEQLKPIALEWMYLPTYTPSYPTISFDISKSEDSYTTTVLPGASQIITADLNGDGIADIIHKAKVNYKTNTNNGLSNCSVIYTYKSLRNQSGNIEYNSIPNYSFIPEDIPAWGYWTDGPLICDFNGDGLNDILVPYIAAGVNHYAQFFYIDGQVNSYETDGPGSFFYVLQNQNNVPLYTSSDLDKDGRADIIVLETGSDSGNRYEMCIFKGTSSSTTVDTVRTALTLSSSPRKLFTGDYNNDGLTDLLVIHNYGYNIVWNQGGALTSAMFSGTPFLELNTYFSNAYRLYEGDFNGDGTIDFLSTQEDNSAWNFLIGNGDGTFTQNVACTLSGAYKSSYASADDGKNFTCIVYDMDGDGKSDVFISKAKYNYSGNFENVHTYWLLSNGSTLTEKNHIVSSSKDNASLNYYSVGDFNGDGLAELTNYGYNCYLGGSRDAVLRTYVDQDYNPNSGKITEITDGYGKTTRVSYGTMTAPSIYTKGTGAEYPVVDCTVPIHAVSGVIDNYGTDFAHSVSYSYGKLKCHVAGKGLLGLGRTTKTDWTMSTYTCKETTLGTNYLPSATNESSTVDNQTATTVTTYGNTQPHAGKKSWFTYPLSVFSTDLDGDTVRKSFEYDANLDGVLTKSTVSHTDGTEITQYQNYARYGGKYLPADILRTTQYTGKSSFTERDHITYNGMGLQAVSISRYNKTKPVTTSYTYDSFGNITEAVTSATGVENVEKTFQYDATHRFVIHETNRQQVTDCTYDIWGNVVTKTDNTRPSNPYTVNYTYDGWGNLKSESHPTGQLTTYIRGWASNGNSFLVTQGTGQPWTKTFYDSQRRKIRVETISWLDMPVAETFTYNAKDQLIGHLTGLGTGNDGLGIVETMQYDSRGRLTSKVGAGQERVDYTYGQKTVTTTKAGCSVTKRTDLWGNVVEMTDTAGTTTYNYGSHGNPLSASFGGNTIYMTYDAIGRRLTITDPDAGQMRYSYDAYDRPLSERSPNDKTRYYRYDAWGQLVADSLGFVTSYVYGQTDSDRGLLLSVEASSTRIDYTYDSFGRQTNESRTFNNVGTWGTALSYNSIGQLASKQYSGGPTVTYTYDAYGFPDETRANGTLIRKPQYHSAMETIDKCGTNLVRHWIYGTDLRLTDIALYDPVTELGHDLCYTYDSATGNVVERYGMFDDYEFFTYDALDRLTEVSYAPNDQIQMSYSPNGNIASQTGIGNYYYDSTRPHAVTLVDNTDAIIPLNSLSTESNSSGKIYRIFGAQGNRMFFMYGPDKQRWRTIQYKYYNAVRTIYYMGDCEQIVEGGNTRRLYYIGDDAVYVKQDNQPDSIWFMFTDKQGSVVAVLDYDGNELFCASYDAWGRQTVEHNDIGFRRGYTGHEMLPEFGLINMNGRLYDPLVCQFLSPDPYVQEPYNSQNFNRYSYCLNNPMRYTDPSGEWFGIDDFIACLLGGVVNLGVNLVSGNIHSFGHGLASFALGAAAGEVALYGQVEISAILTGAGNSLINQTFDNGWKNIQWDEVAFAGGMSLGLSIIGSEVSSLFNNQINQLFSGIHNELLRNTLIESSVSSMTGFILDGGFSLINGDGVSDAWNSALQGAQMGFITGAINGFGKGIIEARNNKRSPWTGERTQRHHSDPLFMGGDKNQELTTMSTSRHQELHRELNEFLFQQRDKNGNHMRPQRGNDGQSIQRNFNRARRLDAMREFYDLHPIKNWDARRGFYKNNNLPWSPW